MRQSGPHRTAANDLPYLGIHEVTAYAAKVGDIITGKALSDLTHYCAIDHVGVQVAGGTSYDGYLERLSPHAVSIVEFTRENTRVAAALLRESLQIPLFGLRRFVNLIRINERPPGARGTLGICHHEFVTDFEGPLDTWERLYANGEAEVEDIERYRAYILTGNGAVVRFSNLPLSLLMAYPEAAGLTRKE